MEKSNEDKTKRFYLCVSRQELIKIWKKANQKSIEIHGKKKLGSTISIGLKQNDGYPVIGKEQVEIEEIY